uniref:C2H2-type domain-containing protein n=1 Tax=Anopheles atroparvus TaxID=41427 RepID=A0AAG5DTH5_ANOAO
MNSLVIVYVPHSVEYTPAVQFSSLQYATVSFGDSEREEEEGGNAKSVAVVASKALDVFSKEALTEQILKDDLLSLSNVKGKQNRSDLSLLDATRQSDVAGLQNQLVLDYDIKPSKYAALNNDIILEESSSSLDEGIGLSNTEDSGDDQASGQPIPAHPTTKSLPLPDPKRKACTRSQKGAARKSYHCEICEEQFPMKKQLRAHQAKEHPGQHCNKCTICQKTFKLRSNLRQHLRIHTGERPFHCGICGKTFVQGSALTVHRELHKAERDYECTICQKAFKSKFAFKKHEKVHAGLRPFKCEVCGKCFTQSCNMKAHQKLHTGNHAYQCPTCSKTFRFKSHYQDHLMTHTKEKKYCCAQCGRTFAYKNSYQRHVLIHRDETQHPCTVCGKQFAKLSHLTFHRKSHVPTRAATSHGTETAVGMWDEKGLTCNMCGFVFEGNEELLAHRREVHGYEGNDEGEQERCRYKCVICSKSFHEEKELRTHFKLHEAEDCPFQCGMCGILNLTHT